MKTKDLLKESLTWTATGDAEYPFTTLKDQKKLKVRLNDFPAEQLYTIVGAGAEVSFDDWPKTWKKSASTTKKKAATPARAIRKQVAITT
ncbi:MAG TPA: hypothetical protein PKA82_10420 [Pyrinomonadaceae bacterium]|nr:hypothetical protein [Pyrinomonadaceae bacterium]